MSHKLLETDYKTTPYELLSLYENASIVSGLVWGINSFDQFGVELGKEIAKNISNDENLANLSSAGKEFLKKL